MRPASDTSDETKSRQHSHKQTYELEGTHNKKHIQLETLVKTYKGDRTCAKERSATLGPAFKREENYINRLAIGCSSVFPFICHHYPAIMPLFSPAA